MQQRRQPGGDWISAVRQHRNRHRFQMATGGEIKTYSFSRSARPLPISSFVRITARISVSEAT